MGAGADLAKPMLDAGREAARLAALETRVALDENIAAMRAEIIRRILSALAAPGKGFRMRIRLWGPTRSALTYDTLPPNGGRSCHDSGTPNPPNRLREASDFRTSNRSDIGS